MDGKKSSYSKHQFSYDKGVGKDNKLTTKIFENLIWMTTEETAFYLRKSTNAIRLMVFKGDLKPRKFKRRLYFKKEELDLLLDTAFY